MNTFSRFRSPSFIFLALAVLITSCTPTPPGSTQPRSDAENQVAASKLNRVTNPQTSAADLEILAAGNYAFAMHLYQQLRQKDGNLFFSPYSISLALGMTYGGARGETAQQMADVFHFTLPADQLHPAFNAVDQALAALGSAPAKATPSPSEPAGQGLQLNLANAIWGQKGHIFLQSYLDLLAQNYGAGVRLVDFEKATEQARQAINDWVSQQTQQKIKDLFPQGSLDSSTRLALVNAIYFKASWLFPFNESATKDGPFHLKDGSQVSVPMMNSSIAATQYLQGDGFQAVSLPYFDRRANMVVVLPEVGQFDNIDASLDTSKVEAILNGLQSNHIDLTLPKLKIESSFSLGDALANLGMPAAFAGGKADFSGMDGQRDLFISAVVHKAFVAVDEKGTEAAAATGVAVAASAMMNPPVVVVDRPFIFFIYAPESGTILFAGRVMDPR
ncbi:MAG: serpin family protein [Anaerolineaceae bacterium]|nr:serpin family protein [Anaerolineaceae bacterium]